MDLERADMVGIASLAHLRKLVVDQCECSRKGAAAFTSLTSLVNLQTLLISEIKIGCVGADLFGSLTQLRELDASWCGLGFASAAKLANLRELTSLKVDGNMFGPLAAARLAASVNLRELAALDNPLGLAGIERLASLTKLTSLDIGCNTLPASHVEVHVPPPGLLAQLWQWPLQLLGLRGLQGAPRVPAPSPGEIYRPLTRLTRLRVLSVGPVSEEVKAALLGALTLLDHDSSDLDTI